VLLFHSLTVHGALPNLTDRLRLSVDYRFQAAAEPIAGPSLTPHYSFMAMMPAWDELAAGWGSAEWATSPAELAVVDFGPAAGPLVVPPSTLLADPASG
jgi:ectoine hydroxylase-related dioxygenase (phytanoyl-CoA dioxygenase family)